MIILTKLELKHVHTPPTTFLGKLLKNTHTDIVWGTGDKTIVNPLTITYIEKTKHGSKIWFGFRDYLRVKEDTKTILNLIKKERDLVD